MIISKPVLLQICLNLFTYKYSCKSRTNNEGTFKTHDIRFQRQLPDNVVKNS